MSCPTGVNVVNVTSALEMKEEVMKHFDNSDIVIKAAAVADYRPKSVSDDKIKKTDENLSIELEKNPDILKELGQRKNNQILVGFCMETKDLIENAKKKLESKNLDFIVANNLKVEGAGFGTDTNVVSIIERNGNKTDYEKMSKFELANIILDKTLK